MSFLHLIAISALVPGALGTQDSRTAKISDPFNMGGLRVRVLSVTHGLATYRQKYDQRANWLKPGFGRDVLVAIEMDAENPTRQAISLDRIVPMLVDAEGVLVDHPHFDVRQRSFVRTNYRDWQNPQDLYSLVYDPVSVAPGGRVKFAVLFSISPLQRGNRLVLSTGRMKTISGVPSPITEPGPVVEISLGD